MTAPLYSAADYLAALQSLMPRGRAWPRDPDATQARALAGLAPTYERQNQRANQLLVDAFPATTVELLPEWESALGLPDPLAGAAPTIEARRAQVLARFVGAGGQSIPYITAYALNLGYAITVTQFAPARVGMLRVGMPVYGPDFAHVWQINVPLDAESDALLEPALRKIAPAHTVVIFNYS